MKTIKKWKWFSSLMGNLCSQLFNIIFEKMRGRCTEQQSAGFYGKMQEHFALSLCLNINTSFLTHKKCGAASWKQKMECTQHWASLGRQRGQLGDISLSSGWLTAGIVKDQKTKNSKIIMKPVYSYVTDWQCQLWTWYSISAVQYLALINFYLNSNFVSEVI